MSDPKPFRVLFLCNGNSARSIFAECILNRLGQGRFHGYSAGSQPAGEVHQYTIDLLKRLDYRTDGLRSKSWDEFAGPDAQPFDLVVTVCNEEANEVCPVWPGQPISAHWGVRDPVGANGKESDLRLAFSEAYRMLESRISMLVKLPIRSLKRPDLQRRLDEIGMTLPKSA